VSPDRCNIIDLLQNAERELVPTPVPSRAPVDAGDPSNTKFVSEISAHTIGPEVYTYISIREDGMRLFFVFSVSFDIQHYSSVCSFFVSAIEKYECSKCGVGWDEAKESCSLATHCPE
jgi:hypothetical protein